MKTTVILDMQSITTTALHVKIITFLPVFSSLINITLYTVSQSFNSFS